MAWLGCAVRCWLIGGAGTNAIGDERRELGEAAAEEQPASAAAGSAMARASARSSVRDEVSSGGSREVTRVRARLSGRLRVYRVRWHLVARMAAHAQGSSSLWPDRSRSDRRTPACAYPPETAVASPASGSRLR